MRGLFASLYRKHPVGGLLVWATESQSAAHRGDGALAAGIVLFTLSTGSSSSSRSASVKLTPTAGGFLASGSF